MNDWVNSLTPEEQREWEGIVNHARTVTYQAMSQSGFIVSMVPDGIPDIKFCVELGMAVMMDKPVVAVVLKGRPVSTRLRRLADAVIELTEDTDTEAGREELRQAFLWMTERYGQE